jgi:hypothetical protein
MSCADSTFRKKCMNLKKFESISIEHNIIEYNIILNTFKKAYGFFILKKTNK